jgi:hypothetical protein
MLADLVMDATSNRTSRQLSTAETDSHSQAGMAQLGALKLDHEQVSKPAGVDYWLQGSCVRLFRHTRSLLPCQVWTVHVAKFLAGAVLPGVVVCVSKRPPLARPLLRTVAFRMTQ